METIVYIKQYIKEGKTDKEIHEIFLEQLAGDELQDEYNDILYEGYEIYWDNKRINMKSLTYYLEDTLSKEDFKEVKMGELKQYGFDYCMDWLSNENDMVITGLQVYIDNTRKVLNKKSKSNNR